MSVGGKTFEELVDLYLDRCHLGDAPDIAVFAAEHPEHAAELLETLPLLNDLETIGDADAPLQPPRNCPSCPVPTSACCGRSAAAAWASSSRPASSPSTAVSP